MMQRLPASAGAAAPARVLAAVAAIVAGVIHLGIAPEHFHEASAFGIFMVVVGVAQMAAGFLLLVRPSRALIGATVLGTLLVFAVYALSRTTGLPFGPHPHEREGIHTIDVISKAAELVLLLMLSSLAGSRRWADRPAADAGSRRMERRA